MLYFSVYICYINAPIDLEGTRNFFVFVFCVINKCWPVYDCGLLTAMLGVHKTRSGSDSVLASKYTSSFSQISRQEVSVYVGPKNKIGGSDIL